MSAYDLQGKVAIVTGAGSGINHAFAETLLASGCSVVFADLKLRPEAEETVARYAHPSAGAGPSAVFHQMDQSNWAQIQETWDFALATFGTVDLLCPGAGIWEPPHSSFWHPPGVAPEAADDPGAAPGSYQTLAVNLAGPLRFAQLALDYWLRHKVAGNLLLVASLAAYMPTVGTPLYAAAKGGLVAFARSLAQARARLGVRVAAVCPATTFTPAVLQAYCRGKVRAGDMNMTAAECAAVMRDLVTLPRYGDGSVVEAMQFGPPGGPSDVRVRELPFAGLLPDIDPAGDFSGKNILVKEEELWQRLKDLA